MRSRRHSVILRLGNGLGIGNQKTIPKQNRNNPGWGFSEGHSGIDRFIEIPLVASDRKQAQVARSKIAHSLIATFFRDAQEWPILIGKRRTDC